MELFHEGKFSNTEGILKRATFIKIKIASRNRILR